MEVSKSLVGIRDTLNFLTDYNDVRLQEEEILLMLNMHIRKAAAHNKTTIEEFQQLLEINFESFKNKWSSAFIMLQLEQERIKESAIPTHLTEYRYSVGGIVNIFKKIIGKQIHRKTITDHMKPNRNGFIKLKKVSLPKEHNSVLESDLLEYLFNVTGIHVDPIKIRKYNYKAPVNEKPY